MSFSIRHRFGGIDQDPDLSVLPTLLDELAFGDPEHPKVGLVCEDTGLALSVFGSHFVVLDNGAGSRHLRCTDREHVLRLLTALASQRYDELEAEPWAPGFG